MSSPRICQVCFFSQFSCVTHHRLKMKARVAVVTRIGLLCVCVCRCVSVCMCVCMYECACVCVCVLLCVFMCV